MAMMKKKSKAAEGKEKKHKAKVLEEKAGTKSGKAMKAGKGAAGKKGTAARIGKKTGGKKIAASEAKQETVQGFEVAKDAKGVEAQATDFEIVKHPLVTEKAVNMIEVENKLTFIVSPNATKPLVKKAVEELYKVRANKVNIVRDMKGRKRAIVTIDKKYKASDVATKLGVI